MGDPVCWCGLTLRPAWRGARHMECPEHALAIVEPAPPPGADGLEGAVAALEAVAAELTRCAPSLTYNLESLTRLLVAVQGLSEVFEALLAAFDNRRAS